MYKTSRRPGTGIALLSVVLASVSVVSLGTAGAAHEPYCGITWGSLAKGGDGSSDAALSDVRTGVHECFDRVIFDFVGSAAAYEVDYAPEIRTSGKGERLPVAGGAMLRVHLHTNVFDRLGRAHYGRVAGDHVADVHDYRTLRDVVYGGGFERRLTFGVGVRARLPFRVFTLPASGSSGPLVIDVAHRW